jgi:replicative DNA helicase Mcm
MTPELDKKLCDKYPVIFRQRGMDMSQTAMCWGFQCENGWWNLLDNLCAQLDLIHKKFGIITVATTVKEKYGCYDGETEVLTKQGWKRFYALSKDDEIASLNGGSHLVYEKPTDIISEPYKGKMYELKTRGVDLLVTPNHNLYVAKGTYWNGRYSPPKKVTYDYELVKPDKFFGKNKMFKKDAKWDGVCHSTFEIEAEEKRWSRGKWGCTGKKWPKLIVNMDAWLTFLGWYTAEGSVSLNTVSIAANNTDGGKEREIVLKSIIDVGFDPSISMEDRSAVTYRIHNKQLGDWLVDNCGKGSSCKKVPNFIKELCPRQIEIFLKALYLGDGHKTKTAYVLTTISKQLADDVQDLLLKVGNSSSLALDDRPLRTTSINGKNVYQKHHPYLVNWLKNGYHNTQDKGLAKGSRERWIDFDGMVYCVSVPSRVIYVRRNGIPVWCGNSLRFYYSNDFDPGRESKDGDKEVYDLIEEVVAEAERISEFTCEECGKPGCLCEKNRWYQTLCPEHSALEGYAPASQDKEI